MIERFLVALLFSLSAASTAYAQAQPNVVVMLADNMGYGDLGSYGSGGDMRSMATPRIDALAKEGLRMTQFFVEPGCTPSRAALMLGRYSQRAGLSTIIINGSPNTLQDKEVTMAVQIEGLCHGGGWQMASRRGETKPTHQPGF
jgi:hypothetical protein